MKNPVLDPNRLQSFSEKLYTWLKEQTGGVVGEIVDVPELHTVTEYPLYRLTYRVETETRTVTAFSRPDAALIMQPPTVTSAGQADLWAVARGEVHDFVSRREVQELPGSLVGAPCAACGGTGRRDCPDCNGQKGLYCPECRGDGKIPCPVCKHTRRMTCPECQGHGKVYNDAGKTFTECPACRGKGELPCTACDTGYQVCAVCEGKGRTPCTTCGQTGTVACKACGGKRQIVSGLQVEIVLEPREECREIENMDIPPQVLTQVAARGIYERELEVNDYAGIPAALAGHAIPSIICDEIGQMCGMADQGPACRVALSHLTVEKKSVYAVTYDVGPDRKTAWAVSCGSQMFIEPGFVTDMYTVLLDHIRRFVARDDLAMAAAACHAVRSIAPLQAAALDIERIIRRKTFLSYAGGAVTGAAAFAAAMIPVLHDWRGASLHYYVLVAGTLLAGALASAVVASLLYGLQAHLRGGRYTRLSNALVLTVVLLVLVFGALAWCRFDPARSLDRAAMDAAYREHFPFGLRTLANAEDIDFLKGLITRYEPTGVDMDRIYADLDTLEGKLAADQENIARLERISRDMKNLLDYGRKRRAPVR